MIPEFPQALAQRQASRGPGRPSEPAGSQWRPGLVPSFYTHLCRSPDTSTHSLTVLGGVARETVWPTKPKAFTIWPFPEKACRPPDMKVVGQLRVCAAGRVGGGQTLAA